MKDTNTTEGTTNSNSEIISNQMECDSTKPKDTTFDEAPYMKPSIENISEIKKTVSENMEIVSTNNEIKPEAPTAKDDQYQNASLDDTQNQQAMDVPEKFENTDNTLTNEAEKLAPKNEASTNLPTIAESTEMDTSETKSESKSSPDCVKSEIEKNTGDGNKNNDNNVIKRKRSRHRKPRPSKKARLKSEKLATIALAYENICSPEKMDDVEYCLTVTNLPNRWSFMDIKNYIDVQCGPVDEIEMVKDDNSSNGAIRLSYQTEDECKKAMEKLMDKEIEGAKLAVSLSVVSLDQVEESEQPDTPEPPSVHSNSENTGNVVESTLESWKPDLDIWEIDPKGLYGLKELFLKSLDITPPLDKWVHVTNFRCDKSELRDVLEMAGKVLLCTVFLATTPKYAKVMYSHPIEAVQAVSMLNGQTFYGQALKVVMDRSPMNTVILPKGLNGIGVGLGANGKPLRTVVQHFHRFMTNESASLNRTAFDMPDNLAANEGEVAEEPFTVKNVEELTNFVLPKDTNKTNDMNQPKVNSPVTKSQPTKTPVKSKIIDKKPVPPPSKSPMRPQFSNQNFQQRNFGQNFGQFSPRPGWGGPGPDPRMNGPFGPGAGPRPGWNGPGPMGSMAGPRPMPGPMHRPMHGPMPGPMAGPRPMSGPMTGPMQGQVPGPMQAPMQVQMPGPMQAPMQGSMQGPMMGPRPMGPGFGPGNEPVQLQFSNLPPSTTFAILCEKMAACGQVVSIQLTTPGCAVVTFANRIQADMCYQSYNNMCVEGCVIQVKYT